jgi:hypothetical protein
VLERAEAAVSPSVGEGSAAGDQEGGAVTTISPPPCISRPVTRSVLPSRARPT